MLIPINADTFKKSFFDGTGNLEISTDQDIWTDLYEFDKSFSKNVDKIAELKLGVEPKSSLKFGEKNKLALDVDFSGQIAGKIDLIWPGDDDEAIKKYQLESFLTANRLYVALLFNAKADGKIDGKMPVGALSADFGIGAGGYVGYQRLIPYDQTKTVKSILNDLFAETRLPQRVNKISEIPREGEVIVLEYGGYLSLNAGLSWGYSLSGTRSFNVQDLALAADYALKLAAEAKFGYKLAGEFSIEARRGKAENWVRFVVRKKRRSEFNFAADFGLTADVELKGLPESADDFLAALFGTKAKTFLDHFAKAEKYSSPEELEKALGALAGKYLQKLSNDLIGKALSNETLKEFLAAVEKTVNYYNSLDDKIINLYEDYLDKIPQLQKVLDDILKLKKFENLSGIVDPEVWTIIRKLSGEKFYDLLLDQTSFGEFLEYVQKAKDFLTEGASEQIRKIIGDLKKEFPLDTLFNDLAKYDTPEKLKNLADQKLKALAERLLGKAFNQLGDFKAASREINETLKKITEFKNKWYEKLTESAKQSFKANLNYAYIQASESDALIDVELNLAEVAGQSLADSAAAGDFSEILGNYNPKIVRLNPNSIFTKKLEKSAHLQINVLGWGYERLVELIQKVDHAIEVEPTGLMHVFTLDTQINQLTDEKKRGKVIEEVKSNFLFRAIGAAFQPIGSGSPVDQKTDSYVISILNKMAVSYQLAHHDTKTSPKELRLYLDLAQYLGLIKDRDLFISELQNQFPKGFGDVKVEYVVRYDDQTVRNAFTLSGEELKDQARHTVRELMATRYTGLRETSTLSRVGFAYLSENYADIYYHGGGGPELIMNAKGITLPAWFTGGSPIDVKLDDFHRRLLVILFANERKYADRLNNLDELIDKSVTAKMPIPLNSLAKASREFVDMADDLDEIKENCFFLAFDKLAHTGSSDKWRRESALVLTIKSDKGEEVVKYLMA